MRTRRGLVIKTIYWAIILKSFKVYTTLLSMLIYCLVNISYTPLNNCLLSTYYFFNDKQEYINFLPPLDGAVSSGAVRCKLTLSTDSQLVVVASSVLLLLRHHVECRFSVLTTFVNKSQSWHETFSIFVNNSQSWRETFSIFVNKSQSWRETFSIFVNKSQSWRETFSIFVNKSQSWRQTLSTFVNQSHIHNSRSKILI